MKIRHYNIWVKIGLNILYYRKEQRLTQAQLAEICGDGVSTNHIQRIETGAAGCSVDTLIDIAQALNIPLYKLFEFKE
jgi:transcriptional regulator with XRE-family HTH domain